MRNELQVDGIVCAYVRVHARRVPVPMRMNERSKGGRDGRIGRTVPARWQ